MVEIGFCDQEKREGVTVEYVRMLVLFSDGILCVKGPFSQCYQCGSSEYQMWNWRISDVQLASVGTATYIKSYLFSVKILFIHVTLYRRMFGWNSGGTFGLTSVNQTRCSNIG